MARISNIPFSGYLGYYKSPLMDTQYPVSTFFVTDPDCTELFAFILQPGAYNTIMKLASRDIYRKITLFSICLDAEYISDVYRVFNDLYRIKQVSICFPSEPSVNDDRFHDAFQKTASYAGTILGASFIADQTPVDVHTKYNINVIVHGGDGDKTYLLANRCTPTILDAWIAKQPQGTQTEVHLQAVLTNSNELDQLSAYAIMNDPTLKKYRALGIKANAFRSPEEMNMVNGYIAEKFNPLI